MNRWVLSLVTLLALGGGTFWWATSLPEAAREIESEVLESLRRNDEAPPEGNGYQKLIALWGPPWEWSAEETRLARYRRWGMKKTLATLARKPEKFAADLELTESFLEPLLVALNSPRITWDSVLKEDPYNLEDMRGFPGMRGVTNMLTVVGFHYFAQGRSDEGLRVLLTACEFPARFSDHLVVIESLMRGSTQLGAVGALLEILTQYQLNEAQLTRASEALARAEQKRDAFGMVMDTEYTVTRRELGRLESRRLTRFYLRYRERFYNPTGELTQEELERELDEAGVAHLFKMSPRHLILARENHRVLLTATSAARLVVAVQLHQRRHGSYPLSLKELGYEGEDVFGGGRPFDYHSDGSDFSLSSESPKYAKLDYFTTQSYYPYRHFRPDPRKRKRRSDRGRSSGVNFPADPKN